MNLLFPDHDMPHIPTVICKLIALAACLVVLETRIMAELDAS
jgi:hypothetical protein